MEAELTALAMLLLNMVERGHYDVDVYTDCAELIPYMRPRSALPERPALRRLVAWCRTLIRHTHAHGGKVVLRHVRWGWNKRANALCNQAMNCTTTPTLTAQQCFRTQVLKVGHSAAAGGGQPGALAGGAGGGDVPLLVAPIPRASRETQAVLDFVASIPEQHVAFPEIATFRKIPARFADGGSGVPLGAG